ncbi:DUF5709 domain-containing protein [Thermobifida fusca]|jgi:hypothetical protein|uniref:DUF5709 domain-containing protein n=1 Tax=Thermobifida fusca (strain YX) TaxID=269800 RepID=Q47N12_THEFY|nr:DUF5709 domain-containing protein [Thermobifida fusca]AAZ56157.1 conserved hypothetical protein [Thermobifida fusca YX]MDD6792531.1 DUF5709 domain-containing protein [Thermobifida fusca]QOS58656.1 hypothetical protein IM867_15150 [Thermobifida fusca]
MAEIRNRRSTDPVLLDDLDEDAVVEETITPSTEETRHGRPEDPIHALDSDYEDAGQPALADTTEDTILPSERPIAMDEFGTTGTDKEAGEPLDTALSREEPEVWEREEMLETEGMAEASPSAGRLVAEDEGVRPDLEAEATAEDVGLDRGGLAPEERAVREREEP